MFGLRPVATSRCEPAIVFALARARPAPCRPQRATRATLTPVRITMPSRASCVEHDRGAFRIVLGERRRGLQHRHPGAEPAVRLRELEPDRPRADDEEMLGAALELEDRLVGEIGRLGQSRDRRHRGGRAGRDHEAPRLDLEISDRDGCGIGEARRAGDHVHAEAGEALLRVVRRDRRDDAVHMRVAPWRNRLPRAAASGRTGRRGAAPRRASPPRAAPWRGRSHSSGSRRPSCPFRSAPPARRTRPPRPRPKARRSRRRSRRCRG